MQWYADYLIKVAMDPLPGEDPFAMTPGERNPAAAAEARRGLTQAHKEVRGLHPMAVEGRTYAGGNVVRAPAYTGAGPQRMGTAATAQPTAQLDPAQKAIRARAARQTMGAGRTAARVGRRFPAGKAGLLGGLILGGGYLAGRQMGWWGQPQTAPQPKGNTIADYVSERNRLIEGAGRK